MKRFLSFILSFLLIFNPNLIILVKAEEESSSSGVIAQETIQVENNNEANIENNLDLNINTGQNEINPTTSPWETPQEGFQEAPIPSPEPSASLETIPLATVEPTELQLTETPIVTPESSPTNQSTSLPQESETTLDSFEPSPNNLEVNLDDSSPSTTSSDLTKISLAGEKEEIEIKNDNESTVSGYFKIDANSGENQASQSAKVEIETGEISILANLANVINDNLTGSNFFQFLINIFNELTGDINLANIEANSNRNNQTNILAQNSQGEGNSNAIALGNYQLKVINDNLVFVENTIEINAQTGGNKAQGEEANIKTGNINILLNLFNLLNTNLTGNNWFFSIINVFNNLNGNIILPYEKWFINNNGKENPKVLAQNLNQETEMSGNLAIASLSEITKITNNNTAQVDNNITAIADSGHNQASGEEVRIKSGQVAIENNLLNIVNTNFVGNNWLFVAVNLLGNWTGKIVNSTYDLITGSLGFFIFKIESSSIGKSDDNVLAVNQSGDSESSNFAYASYSNSLTVKNNNQALLTNNINIFASSGNNKASSCGDCQGGASINTGNISIKNNLANFVNTNITGDNWYFLMLNIFGDWLGDLIFARPDLEVKITDNKEKANPGEILTYKITYKNLGEVEAQGSLLETILPQNISFISASNGGVYSDGLVRWNLGKIARGDEGFQEVVVKINDNLNQSKVLTAIANIKTSMDEPNLSNNSSSDPTEVLIGGPQNENSSQKESSSSNTDNNNDNSIVMNTSNNTASSGETNGQVLGAQTLPIAGSNNQELFWFFLILGILGFFIRKKAQWV